jgi:hypothetical protein
MTAGTTTDREREAALLDALGEDSFPASDPPAVWTWDVAPRSTPGNAGTTTDADPRS